MRTADLHTGQTRTQAALYGLLGLPLAFVALPVYVHLPQHHARAFAMPLATLGMVLLFSRLLDALIDPRIGQAVDALYARSRRAVATVAVLLSLLLALGFQALFVVPQSLRAGGPGLWVWMGVALALCHVSCSALLVLHQAWAARQGGGVREQSRWVAWREGLGLLGVLLACVLPTLAGWWLTWAVLCASLAAGLWAWNRLARQWPSAPQASPATAMDVAAHAPGAHGLWQPWRHARFRRLLAVFTVNGMASAIPATLVLFFVQDRLQAPPAWQPVFLGLYFLAGALSMPLWLALIARRGLLPSWCWGMCLSVLSFSGVLLLGPGDLTAFALVCALSGMALGADLSVPGALLNQTIDACGQRGRSDGAFLGWWGLATKLNLALAAGLALPLLGAWGYAPGQRDPQALLALGLAYGLLPCLLKLLAIGLLWRGLMAPAVGLPVFVSGRNHV
jgi:Na+/melibiose symporter-like transporter